MDLPRDSLDLARKRFDSAANKMASEDELIRNVESPPYSPPQVASPTFSSPRQILTPHASFNSNVSSPGAQFSPSKHGELPFGQAGELRKDVRSRGASFTSVFSERLNIGRLFRSSSKRRSRRNKPQRDPNARPIQPNVLEEANTGKLTKFWNTVNSEFWNLGDTESTEVSHVHYRQGVVGGSWATSPPVPGISFDDSRLSSIAEDPTTEEEGRKQVTTMDRSRLAPDSSVNLEKKQKAVQDATDMYQLVRRNCERTNTAVPPYDFLELIGKGAFGRVYKCKEKASGNLVAIKIVNTDEVDYQQDSLDKDDTIRDFRKEVTILQQLKDNNAKNVNMIHDAFDLQEQLWIVSDYCTGGSIRTLMRAQPVSHPGLEEQYIIPIARELALAMKSVHDIGVIHRDIKCTNVYVTEEGEIQLGDFGIVGVLDDGSSKRRTMIGTPHYMPREMHIHGGGNQVAEAYGTEVDVWSFGCSVYEIATGQPPNAVKRQDALKMELLNAPRLEGGNHSQELRDFVAYCLDSDPKARPTADQVLRHPYIANTHRKCPTKTLIDLIHRYKAWECSGGWRQSLFFAGGAPPVATAGEQGDEIEGDENDDWNFSTSDSFNEAFEKRYSQMVSDQAPTDLHLDTASGTGLKLVTNMTPLAHLQQRQKDLSASRGERSLERIFTPESDPYELHTPADDPSPVSDLPLRPQTDGAPTRESTIMIDLDSAGEESVPTFNFDFGDVPTLKARSLRPSLHEEEDDGFQYSKPEDLEKRATMDWKFPGTKRATMDWKFPAKEPKEPNDPEADMSLPLPGESDELPPAFCPQLKHTATEPIGQFRDFLHTGPQKAPADAIRESVVSMIDLDLGLSDPAEIVRPSTASSTAGSVMTDATSGNPFDLEDDPAQNEIDRNRFSYHKKYQSEGGQVKRGSRRSVPMHTRGSSLSSTASDLDRSGTDDDDVFNYDYASMRPQMNGTLPHNSVDMNQWPDFGADSGFDRVPGYTDHLDEMVLHRSQMEATHPSHTNGNGFRRPSAAGLHHHQQQQQQLEFPRLLGPHPDALREGADPNTMMQELDRMLDDFGNSMRALSTAFQNHARDERDDAPSEADESGAETSEAGTGDEDSPEVTR